MLIQPTLDTLNRLKLHGMALALTEQMTHNAAQGLAFEERLALLPSPPSKARTCQSLRASRVEGSLANRSSDFVIGFQPFHQ